MRVAVILLLVCPAIWGAPITPTIEETLVEIGNYGFTDASPTYSLSGYDFNAAISGNASTFPGPPDFGGEAVADLTLEGEFLVVGTGSGFLHYTSSGTSDGSSSSFNASYQLNDIDESCLVTCSASGTDPFQLGTPFMLTETGIAAATSGPNFSDAGYEVSVSFFVTDANGDALPITEVALPTPEPGSFALLSFGFGALVTACFLCGKEISSMRETI